MLDPEELRTQARSRLDASTFDYIDGAAGNEITAAENAAAWERLRMRPHVLRDVSEVSTAIRLLDRDLPTPIMVAPMGYQRLVHAAGEVAMAEGAAAAGALMCLSTMSTVRLEEVAQAVPDAARWFQVYLHMDRNISRPIVERAAQAGYEALVFTVDLPVLGERRREMRHDFDLHTGPVVANFPEEVRLRGELRFDPALTAADIEWLRELSGLPVLVKGLVRGDDARTAVDAGASGIVVSNHGGRQLDTTVATADALPEVVAAVGARVPVLVDGGVRTGPDVVKALALGAKAVFIGRPLLWSLAVGGSATVTDFLDQLRAETARTMALCGATAVGELDSSLIC